MKKQILFYGLLGLLTAGTVTGIAIMRHHQSMMPSANANSNNSGHSLNDNSEHNGHGGSQSENEENEVNNTQAELRVDQTINPKQNITLKIDIKDKAGKTITDFDIFQEKLMHLIVVSDDLEFFNHVHPAYQDNGRFVIESSFPQGGNYTLFSDYKPKGKTEQVSVLHTQVVGQSKLIAKIDLTTTKIIDNTQASLSFSQSTIEAGKEVHLIFNLQDITTNKPPEDIQPYLGELGHLVILKQSSPLTRNDYIHAHAMKDTPTGEIHFMAKFPRSGKYKMWGQFNRNGKIVIADFWVNIQ